MILLESERPWRAVIRPAATDCFAGVIEVVAVARAPGNRKAPLAGEILPQKARGQRLEGTERLWRRSLKLVFCRIKTSRDDIDGIAPASYEARMQARLK